MEYTLYIPRDLSADLDPVELAVWSALYKYKPIGQVTLRTSDLYLMMFGTTQPPQKTRLAIVAAINSLIDKHIIIMKKLNHYTIQLYENSFDKPQFFVMVPFKDFITIIRKRMFMMYKYYVAVLASRDNNLEIDGEKGKVGHMPISHFAELLNINPKTVISYNNFLEANHILYIRRNLMVTKTENGYTRPINIYGQYCDKSKVDKYANDNLYYIAKEEKSKHPSRYSLGRKYMLITTKGRPYTEEEAVDLKWYAETCDPPKPWPVS